MNTITGRFGGACAAVIILLAAWGWPGESRAEDPFLSTPYYGNAQRYSWFDHEYPDYGKDGRVMIYTGEDVPSCDPYCYQGHNGYDFSVWYQRILTAADGRVIEAGWDDEDNYAAGYGLMVKVLHANGYATLYGHLSALAVQVGDIVSKGQIIGTSGTTGASSGSHLHFTVYDGADHALDPFGWTDTTKKDPWEVLHPTAHSWFMWNEGEWVGQPLPDPSPLTMPYVEVDDRDPIAFSKGCNSSSCPNWTESSTGYPSSAPHHWVTKDTDATADYWARWTPTFDEAGTYEVWVYVPTISSSSRMVPYTIQSATGTYSAIADQLITQDYNGDNFGDEHWRCLGSYRFAQGSTGHLQMSSATGENPETTKMTADVARFWKVDDTVDPSVPKNKFGVGLTNGGDAGLFDKASDLSGDGGWTLFTCWGVNRNMGGTPSECNTAARELAARGQNVIARLSPPDGQRNIRDDADDTQNAIRTRYTTLAGKYQQVAQDMVNALPQGYTGRLAVQIGNELNLCEEWKITNGQTLTSAQMAQEVAAFQRDVSKALASVGGPLVVLNAPLSPGGPGTCSISGATGFAYGYSFLQAMVSSVPDLFTSGRFDGFASHAYPTERVAERFFVPFDLAAVGLHYYEVELPITGNPILPVYITETGWPSTGPDQVEGNADDYSWGSIGDMLVSAWTSTDPNNMGWLRDPRVVAVTPFVLNYTPDWKQFAWLDNAGTERGQYDKVRQARIAEWVGGTKANDAEILADISTVSPRIIPGTPVSVTIRVRNVGTAAWSETTRHRLGATSRNQVTWSAWECGGYSKETTGNANNSRAYICPGVTVPPGGTYDFNFSISVPMGTAGPVTFGVNMVQEAVEWFGDGDEWSIPLERADCALHHGDLAGCNAAGCTYLSCSEQCHPAGTDYCSAGCNAYCVNTWLYVVNGSFIENMGAWQWGENGGLVSLQVEPCGSGCVSPPAGYPVAVARPNGAGGRTAIWQDITDVQPGLYRLRGFVRASSSAQRAWIQADNGYVYALHCSTEESSSTSWRYLECWFSLPSNQSNVVHVALIASNEAGTAGGWVAWDDIALLGPVPPCTVFGSDIDKCHLAGCSYYSCSSQCHATGTSECEAGCMASCPTGNAEVCPSGSTCSRPGSMTAGTSAAVKLYVKNTGNTTWTAGTSYRLSSLTGSDFTWSNFECAGVCNGPGDCRAVLCNSVAPGQVYDFDFSVTAPTTTGTYDLDTQMIREGVARFGETEVWDVSVTAPLVDNADVCPSGYTCSKPTSTVTGATTAVKVWVKNIGTTTWSPSTYRLVALSSNDFTWTGFECGGSCNSGPGSCQASLCSNVTVAPGNSYDFDFKVVAPSSPGTYDLDLQMSRDGVGRFGDTEYWDVTVVTNGSDAEVMETQSTVPGMIARGESSPVTLRVKNWGNTTWTAGTGFKLGAASKNGVTWSGFSCGGSFQGVTDARAYLCHDVPPGGTHDFRFNLSIPLKYLPTSVDLAVRMVKEGVAWFGETQTWTLQVFTEGGSECDQCDWKESCPDYCMEK